MYSTASSVDELVVASPYYRKLLNPMFEVRKVAEKKHVRHLIGHLLYVEQKIQVIGSFLTTRRSWRPLQVLNEMRSAVMYLSSMRRDIDELWVYTFGEPRKTPEVLTELFEQLSNILSRLFPYPIEKINDDIQLLLPEGQSIGPLYSVYLKGIFHDTWSSVLDLATAWGVPSARLIRSS